MPEHSVDGDVTWTRIEEGFYVGSRRGDFTGYIDRLPNEGYIAFNAFSQGIGSYPDRESAMTAVASGQRPANEGQQW